MGPDTTDLILGLIRHEACMHRPSSGAIVDSFPISESAQAAPLPQQSHYSWTKCTENYFAMCKSSFSSRTAQQWHRHSLINRKVLNITISQLLQSQEQSKYSGFKLRHVYITDWVLKKILKVTFVFKKWRFSGEITWWGEECQEKCFRMSAWKHRKATLCGGI